MLTLQMISREFKAVHWAAPTLVIQPPNGRTLVNFDTNFYTELTEPAAKTVHPLGIAVTIEATPTAYTWSWGDGSSDETTSEPGAAYPDLDVTHRYLDKGVTVRPQVTVTYAGRYRIEGGPWQAIPETLDVAGPTVALRVLSATPALVG